MPWIEVNHSTPAAADSAATTDIELRRVSLLPIVRTMRQPPSSVPRAIAECEASTTQSGTAASELTFPDAMSNARMMPIVF